jgi:hypothetical protein
MQEKQDLICNSSRIQWAFLEKTPQVFPSGSRTAPPSISNWPRNQKHATQNLLQHWIKAISEETNNNNNKNKAFNPK